MRLLSGTEVARELTEQNRKRCEALAEKGIYPKLALLRCGENPSDLIYERQILRKAEDTGVRTEVFAFAEDADAAALTGLIGKLNADPETHGILLFRPLPGALRAREREICSHVAPGLDVDCMTDISNAGVYENRALGFPPCTPEACMKILEYYGIETAGKKAVVIGRSLVVGKPVAMMLLASDATVTICHTKTENLAEITAEADLIVTAAGAAGSLTAAHTRPGQTVIDVSVNWDPAAKDGAGGFTGDAVFEEVSKIVDAITPVPGGVGAVTTSVLIGHVITSAEKA